MSSGASPQIGRSTFEDFRLNYNPEAPQARFKAAGFAAALAS